MQQEGAELREQAAAWAEAKAKRLADAEELIKLRGLVRKLEGQLTAQACPCYPARVCIRRDTCTVLHARPTERRPGMPTVSCW